MIIYEHPQNERIRVFLRLESLFDRMYFFVPQDAPHHHHAALEALFDILDITQRSDLKLELLQELERQRQAYQTFAANPDVQAAALNVLLNDLSAAISQMNASVGKYGTQLRGHDWLSSIRNRAAIPGGTCEFDLPSYHHWLHQPAATRQKDLREWLQPMDSLKKAVDTTLDVLRKGGKPEPLVAQHGQHQMSLTGQSEIRLLRLQLDDSLACFPEISSNKYALNVRFTAMEKGEARPRQVGMNVPFNLIRCNL